MTVGIVFPEAFSLWRFHRGLLENLLRNGCEVYVLCPPGDYMEEIKGLGVVFLPIEMYRFIDPLQDVRLLFQLYRLFRLYRFEVVHTFAIKLNIYGAIAARLAGIKTVLSSVIGCGFFNTPVSSFRLRVARLMINILARLTGRLVDRTWFVNPDDLALFVSKGYVPSTRAVLVRSAGVSVSEFHPSAVGEDLLESIRRELALTPSDRVVLMVVARFIWSKGIREFVEASEIVGRSLPEAKFLLVGAVDEGSPDNVPGSFFESKLRPNFQVLAFRQDIKPLLAIADVVCLPSYYGEGVPTILLEAAAMGCPLVATDSVGCREVVEDGKNGYLVPVKDASAVAHAIESVLCAQDRRQEFGRYSRSKAEREFDEKLVNTEVWKRLYEAS